MTHSKRPIKEPGGALLIGLGMSAEALAEAIEMLYPEAGSLTVLADEANHSGAARADEVWVYAPLGLRGFMALMRRISWRRFDGVVQPHAQPRWLKYLVWPRPPWQQGFGDSYLR
ncbi:MAG: hypothetical protein L7U45_07315 [Alphaproteobacteria bacterium]|nr:hypothetical protein [Alphaproteobacteria bacterium]